MLHISTMAVFSLCRCLHKAGRLWGVQSLPEVSAHATKASGERSGLRTSAVDPLIVSNTALWVFLFVFSHFDCLYFESNSNRLRKNM